MKNFQQRGARGGGFSGNKREGDRGGRPSFQNRERGGREMEVHKAVCDECKKACDVPFRPTGDKPVFCRECFALKRGGDVFVKEERGPRPGLTHHEKTMGRADFSRPESKPVFSPIPAQNNNEMKNQLADISSKLDKLISAIERITISKKVAPTETVTSKKAVVTPVPKIIFAKKSFPTKKVTVTPTTVTKKMAEKKVTAKKVVAAPSSKKVVAKKATLVKTVAKKAIAKNIPAKKVLTKKAK